MTDNQYQEKEKNALNYGFVRRRLQASWDAELAYKKKRNADKKFKWEIANQKADNAGRFSDVSAISPEIAGGSYASYEYATNELPADNSQQATDFQRIEQTQIAQSTFIVSIVGSLIWFFLPDTQSSQKPSSSLQEDNQNRGNIQETDQITSPNTSKELSSNTTNLNPWYRAFKTSSIFGMNLGFFLANIIPLSYIHPIAAKVLQYILGDFLGLVFGFAGILFEKFIPSHRKIFQLGKDGWTKYVKAGLVLGSTIGGALGAGIFGFPGIFIGSAIGSVAGAVLAVTAVPLINVIRNKFFNPEKVDIDAEPYRSNYMRAGITIGASLGALIGACVFGPVGAAIGGGIGGLTGAFILAITGPFISHRITKGQLMQSSYDYNMRTAFPLGGQWGIGNLLVGILGLCGVMDTKGFSDAQHVDIKDIVLNAAGLAFSLILGLGMTFYYRLKNNYFIETENIQEKESIDKQTLEKLKDILPWSQRMASSAFLGASIGGFIGTFFPPFGIFIGMGIGGLVFSAACIIGGEKFSEKIAVWKKAVNDKFFPSSETSVSPLLNTKESTLDVPLSELENNKKKPEETKILEQKKNPQVPACSLPFLPSAWKTDRKEIKKDSMKDTMNISLLRQISRDSINVPSDDNVSSHPVVENFYAGIN